MADRGKYDIRNSVNDLTGKEWKFNTKSVIDKSYPINMQHKLRSQHGGQKPPELCKDIIKVFSKEGDIILDPFMGVGGTLLGASLCNRKAIGIDLNERWIEIYKEVSTLEKLQIQQTYIGNSLNILSEFEDETFDFMLTDVPYWNIDTVKKTRNKSIQQSKLSNFDNSTEDQTKDEWLSSLRIIFEVAIKKIKFKKYFAIFIGDIYKGSQYHMLSSDLANEIMKIDNVKMKANLIWVDNSKSLHVFGYPKAYVPSMIHQNILVFRKE